MRRSWLLAAAAVALAVPLAAGAAAGPGVTPTQLLLGTTAPLGQPEAAVARGADAYFRLVNARGGVNGRTITMAILDDDGDPAAAAAASRELADRRHVLAVLGQVGEETALAAREVLEPAGVPQLFVASGSSALAGEAARHPWTVGYGPSGRSEGWILGAYLARVRPAEQVATLVSADGEGADLLTGLQRGRAGSGVRVVATLRVDPDATDVRAQVARLHASGATTLALLVPEAVALRAVTAAAQLGWRPLVLQRAGLGGAGRGPAGAISLGAVKDPGDPAWRDDPGQRLYRTAMAAYAPGANVRDPRHVYGMAIAYSTVEVLKAAGKEPTRARVLAAARSLRSVSNPFLLPGVEVATGSADAWPLEQGRLRRFVDGRWRGFGGLWRARIR